jgi:hypothetical protein
MLLAAGGAPVSVKLRAVNRSKKVRTSLYMYAYFLVRRLICSVFVSIFESFSKKLKFYLYIIQGII